MKKLLLIFTLMLTFVACSDENTGWGEQQRPVIEEVGYLNIADNGLSVIYEHELGSSEIDPDQQSKTRVDESQDGNSGSSTTEEDPCANYWIEVLKKDADGNMHPVTVDGTANGTPIKFKYSDWLNRDKTSNDPKVPGYVVEPEDTEYVGGMSGIKLPVGNYILRACSVEDELQPVSFNPQYEGFREFVVTKPKVVNDKVEAKTIVDVVCKLAYVKVTVQFDEILASLIDADKTSVRVELGDMDNAIEHTYVSPTRNGIKYTYNEDNKDDDDLTKTSYAVYMLPSSENGDPLNLYLTTIYSGSEINDQQLPAVTTNAKKGEYRKVTIKLEHGADGQIYFTVEVKSLVYNQPVTVSVNNYLVKLDGSNGTLAESGIPEIMFESTKYKLAKVIFINDEMFDENGKFKGPLMTLKSKDPIDALYLTATSTNNKIKEVFDELGMTAPVNTEDTPSTAAEGDDSSGTTSSKPAIPGVNLMLDVATAEKPGLTPEIAEKLTELGIANGSEVFENLSGSGVPFSMAGFIELIKSNQKNYGGTYSFTFTPVVGGKTITPMTVTIAYTSIVIDWPTKDMDKEYDSDGLKVNIYVTAINGIKALEVSIKGTLANTNDLVSMGIPLEFDLVNPGDKLATTLEGLGFPVGADVENKTEISFDITGFMEMLESFKGSSQFGLKVVDKNNEELYREIKILVD